MKTNNTHVLFKKYILYCWLFITHTYCIVASKV